MLAHAEALPKVRLVTAKPAQTQTHETVTGQLNTSKLLPMGFEVGGRLAFSRVSKGDGVKAGQLLDGLDTEIIERSSRPGRGAGDGRRGGRSAGLRRGLAQRAAQGRGQRERRSAEADRPSVYVLTQLDPLVLKATVPEALRGQVKPGLKVRAESVAGPAATDEASGRQGAGARGQQRHAGSAERGERSAGLPNGLARRGHQSDAAQSPEDDS